MAEITIEKAKYAPEIIVENNQLGDIMIWQDDVNILVDKTQIAALITALTNLQKEK